MIEWKEQRGVDNRTARKLIKGKYRKERFTFSSLFTLLTASGWNRSDKNVFLPHWQFTPGDTLQRFPFFKFNFPAHLRTGIISSLSARALILALLYFSTFKNETVKINPK